MARILCAISTGYQLRLLSHTGIIARLQQHGHQVSVISNEPIGEGARGEIGGNVEVFDDPVKYNRVQKYYHNHKLNRLFPWPGPFPGTLEIVHQKMHDKEPMVAHVLDASRRFIPVRGRLAIHEMLRSHSKLRATLKRIQPNVVILCNPGLNNFESFLLKEAHSLSIRTIVVAQSWDSFTSKGYVHPKPDLMLCWGQRMQREAIELQGFDPESTVICGAPHFDVYHDLERLNDRSKILSDFGLDPARKTIVYGTSPPVFSPYEHHVVSKLAAWVNADPPESVLGVPTQLIIRPSPQEVIGHYAVRSLAEYEKMVGPHVKLIKPLVRESSLSYDLRREDQELLARALACGDVVGNLLSTFALDGVAAGKPTFCAVFDGDETLPEEQSCRNLLSFTHIQSMLETKGIRMAASYEELQTILRDYLADPSLDIEARNHLISQFLYNIDGQSARRTVDRILACITEETHG